MSDHKDKDTEYKKQRQLSRRAQLRHLQKHIEFQNKLVALAIHEKQQWVDRYYESQKRLDETQKLLPFWIRKFP